MAKSLMSNSPFLGGLNTELNGVTDSTDFTKDELNMMIRQDNTRSRRPGVDYEELFKFNNFGTYQDLIDTNNQKIAFNCIEWTDINSPDESQTYIQTPYIVCQIGGYIIFYENKGQPYSAHQKDFVINLRDYRIDTSDEESYKTERCKFTTAYGCLFITSKAIKPVRLKSAQPDEIAWKPESTLPHCRVSCGVVTDTITSTTGRAIVTKAYGWFFKINGVEIFRMNGNQQLARYPWYNINGNFALALTSTQLAEIWNEIPSEKRLGITCVPKYQHAAPFEEGLINDNGVADHGEYYVPQDYLDFYAPEGSELVYRGTTISYGGCFYLYRGEKWYDNQGTLSGGNVYVNQTDLTLTIRDTSIGANDYLSNETQPEKISYAHLYNLLNQGWTISLIAQYYNAQTPKVFPGNNLAQQYLKDKRTEAFKPTTLIHTTFGDTPAARGHYILNFFNQDRNGMVNLQLAMNNLVSAIGGGVTLQDILDTFDKPFPSTTEAQKAMAAEQVPVVKPRRPYVTDMCSYAGRIFYLCGDVLLYSQIIAEDTRKAAYCYSEADPTSEGISDVVETDGGLMSLPEIGEGLKLQQFGTYLMVFGTRGSMIITGTANNNFTATAYTTGTLPAAPTQAPDSFVETEYGIFYWGTTGVQLVTAGDGGLASKDLSTERILTWFGKLTNIQHQYCKGIYSSSKKRVYWFFPSDEDKPRRLDRVLVFDIMKNAFIPYQIAITDDTRGPQVPEDDSQTIRPIEVPEVVSGVSLKVPFKNVKEYPVESEGDYLQTLKGYDVVFNNEDADYFTDESDPLENNTNIYERAQGAHDLSLTGTISDVLKHVYTVDDEEVTDTYITYKTEYADGETQEFTNCHLQEDEDQIYYYIQDESLESPYDLLIFDANEKFVGTSLAHTASSITFLDYRTNEEATLDIDEDTTTFTFKPNVLKANPLKNYTTTVHTEDLIEVVDNEGIKILADDPIESEEFTYESSMLLCLDVANGKVTFGDFRNNNMRDWTSGDWQGPGYTFDSYLISHPMNAFGYTQVGNRGSDIVHNKNMPYLISYFKRTETGRTTDGGYVYPSKCQGSVLWDWRTNGDFGKWDSPQELYRPNKREIFSEGYVVTKTNVRGIGKAFQIKMESVEDNQFIIEAISNDLIGDGRI